MKSFFDLEVFFILWKNGENGTNTCSSKLVTVYKRLDIFTEYNILVISVLLIN